MVIFPDLPSEKAPFIGFKQRIVTLAQDKFEISGDPEHILTGARSFIGDVPLDYTSWRTLEITPGG